MSADKIIEYGVVLSKQKGIVNVAIHRPEACMHCAANGVCETFSGGKNHEARAKNLCKADVGDTVKIVVPSKGLLFSAFVVYFVPTMAILFGAIAGHLSYRHTGMSQDLSAITGGLSLFTVTLFIIWLFSRKRDDLILPEATEIVDASGTTSCSV